MNDAKIQLSEDELHLALNAQVILTKNRIIRKVYELFGVLSERYKLQFDHLFSFLPVPQSAKIAKGESYNELPYVILDYPRYFTSTDVLAIRTMFWWGNDMSITLHLKGTYQTRFITSACQRLTTAGWYLQGAGSEWQHEYRDDTHSEIRELSDEQLQQVARTSAFAKFSSYIPLKKWDDAEKMFTEKYAELVNTLTG